jgi:hypothetical protein
VAGTYQLSIRLINFAAVNHPDLKVEAGKTVTTNEILRLSLNAEVVVVGKRTFTNLADAENPAEDLVGIASSASQGAITGKQLEVRPFMRQGESPRDRAWRHHPQHSGEEGQSVFPARVQSRSRQRLRDDRGRDSGEHADTRAQPGVISDINLIPELVAGVQHLRRGRKLADQGDFSTAGAGNINYATTLDRPLIRVEGGTYDFGRVLMAFAQVRQGQHAGGVRDVHQLRAVERSDSYRSTRRAPLQPGRQRRLSLTFMGTTAGGTPLRPRLSAPSTRD